MREKIQLKSQITQKRNKIGLKMYLKELEIGNVKLKNNIITAPMAGVTDLPFRIVCKKYGNPGLVYTEMVSSRAMYHGDEKTKKLLNTSRRRKTSYNANLRKQS